MTVIVGLKHDGKIYMGADSAGVANYNLIVRADEKVFIKSNGSKYIMGFTSSFRMGQLLRYALRIPEKPPKMNDYEFMVTSFINSVRDCLKNGGYAKKENETEQGGHFLIGYNGHLYQIYGDYQVAQSMDNYDACGCGWAYALGSMRSTQRGRAKTI